MLSVDEHMSQGKTHGLSYTLDKKTRKSLMKLSFHVQATKSALAAVNYKKKCIPFAFKNEARNDNSGGF